MYFFIFLVDCKWSVYGRWSQCSKSCGGGVQSRFRVIQTPARGGGRDCVGSKEDTRTCNVPPCLIATTRSPRPTTSIRRIEETTTTTRRPRPRNQRVKCFTCGSLFNSDAPDCNAFNVQDQSQQTLCKVGEACLWYSYQKSGNDVGVIRECFSTNILLGSIQNPINPQNQCVPAPVEDANIMACVCTDDLCNGLDGAANVDRSTPKPAFVFPSTSRPPRISTTTQRPTRPTRAPTTRRTTTRRPTKQTAVIRPRDPNKGVLCHQCGSLFSSDGNRDCEVFDHNAPSQQKYCKPSEACLWYTWEKSDTETSTIRECFDKNILIGPIQNPLIAKDSCVPQDIAETPGSRIMACLCENDLCNANDGRPQFSELPRGQENRIGENDIPDFGDLSDEEISIFTAINRPPDSTSGGRNPPPPTKPPRRTTRRPPPRTTTRRTTTRRPTRRPSTTSRPRPRPQQPKPAPLPCSYLSILFFFLQTYHESD